MKKKSLKASNKAKVRDVFETLIKSTNPPTPYNVVVWEDGEKKLKVSFYDARYKEGFTEHGQFIGTYYLETLQEDREEIGKRGLDLHGGIPEWSVDAETMKNLLLNIDDMLKVEGEATKEAKIRSLPYGAKVEAVRKAMKEGMVFWVETYLGTLKVESIDEHGSWAVTGHSFSQRSWAICSTDVDRWFAQIKEPK